MKNKGPMKSCMATGKGMPGIMEEQNDVVVPPRPVFELVLLSSFS